MRVAFVLGESARVGGGFQQSLSTVQAVRDMRGHQVVVLTSRPENLSILKQEGIEAHLYSFRFHRRGISNLLRRSPRARRMFSKLPAAVQRALGPFDHVLAQHRIDILVCFFLSPLPLFLHHSPFIATVYDLCHREYCEFPEVSAIHEFENREMVFGRTLPRAVKVIANSPILAADIVRYYAVDPGRIAILPFLAASHGRQPAPPERLAEVRGKYGLAADYVFYPAQFWGHKNHVYLLEGIKALETCHGVRIDAAFSGSDYGNAGVVRENAERLGIADRVHFLGFVPSEDIGALYTGCRALVMPTYFGPTNVPPLEAMSIGRPVIYSDFPAFRAELGDAALYCDLGDPASLAGKLKLVLEDAETVAALDRAGRALVARTTTAHYAEKFQEILDDFDYLRRRWHIGPPSKEGHDGISAPRR